MPDVFSKDERSRIMAKVKGKDTSIELIVRKTLHGMGFRFRIDNKHLPGNPDLTFRKWEIAVFINGCFWHGHSCKRGARMPRTNREYWEAKIGRNLDRDRRTREDLELRGWHVFVIWECDLEGGIGAVVNHLNGLNAGVATHDRDNRESDRT
ncbi:MAG: very short patch repair endonuclease [Syntrophobacteraceae bacterium]|nr:very short patch repair endonuclease [Syntrophobacteraceae bacterium]